MSGVFVVVQPDGRVEVRPLPAGGRARQAALAEAVGGHVERMAEAFHVLDTHEVFINEDGLDRLPLNPRAHALIGMDAEYFPPCGPVAIVPLPAGQDNRAERAHQCRFFGTLDAVALGLVSAADAGIGALIDVREAS